HLIIHAAAAIDRPVVGAAIGEIGNAVDVLIDCTVGQGPHRRSDRRRDDLVAAGDWDVEPTATVETRPAAAQIDTGAGAGRCCDDRALRRRCHDVLATLLRIIDPVCVPIWGAGYIDRCGSSGQSRDGCADGQACTEAETRVIAAPGAVVVVPSIYP